MDRATRSWLDTTSGEATRLFEGGRTGGVRRRREVRREGRENSEMRRSYDDLVGRTLDRERTMEPI